MKLRASTLYVEQTGGELVGVVAAPKGDRVRLRTVVRVAVGPGASPEDIAAALKDELAETKTGCKRLVVALPRSEVLAWTMRVPGASMGEGELAAAARLQLSKRSRLDEQAAGVAVWRVDDEPDAMVFAAPGPTLDRWRDVARASGLALGAVTLRAFGLARLAPDGTALVLDRSGGASEDVVCADGRLQLSLAVDGAGATAPSPAAARDEGGAAVVAQQARTGLMAEASRTLAAYGIAHPGESIETICLHAPGLEDDAREAFGAAVRLPVVECRSSAMLADASTWDDGLLERAGALIGLCEAGVAGASVPDLLRRPKVAKRTSPVRAAVLLTMMGAVGVVGGVWVLADRETRRLDSAIGEAESAYKSRVKQVGEFALADARSKHAERWVAGGEPMLERLAAVRGLVPGPERVLLDELALDSRVEIGFEKGQRVAYPGTWSVDGRIDASIAGTAVSRDVAAGVRRRLIQGGAREVTTRGADKDAVFRYEATFVDTPETKPAGEKGATP